MQSGTEIVRKYLKTRQADEQGVEDQKRRKVGSLTDSKSSVSSNALREGKTCLKRGLSRRNDIALLQFYFCR